MSGVITSRSHPRLRYVRSLKDSAIRRRERCFAIEGVRLVEEALRAGATPKLVLVDSAQVARTERGRALMGALQGYQVLEVAERALKSAADTLTPQGVVAVVGFPERSPEGDLGSLVLVLDGLGDPGNVGVILRSAEASGIVGAVVAIDTVDVYNPKAVRAAMGAHFRLRLLADQDWITTRAQLAHHRVWLASAAEGVPYYEASLTDQVALVIGNEAHGPSQEAAQIADDYIRIPMLGQAESLNAATAASIIIFEALRQRLVKGEPKGSEEESRREEAARERGSPTGSPLAQEPAEVPFGADS